MSLGLPAWTPFVLHTVTHGGGLEVAATQDSLGPHLLTWEGARAGPGASAAGHTGPGGTSGSGVTVTATLSRVRLEAAAQAPQPQPIRDPLHSILICLWGPGRKVMLLFIYLCFRLEAPAAIT